MDEEQRKRFRNLPLSDDFMFGEVMRRENICRMFLESLLGVTIGKIEYINKQQDISENALSHGIRLDIYLKDGKNTVYNVEMQTTDGSYLYKRVRYYQGMIDRHNLEKGQHYSELPRSYIIMVCTEDLFARGLAVYEREIAIKGCPGIRYDDGSHVYYLNSACTEENAGLAVREFLRCVRENETRLEEYDTELMKAVCGAIDAVRHDAEKEFEYMNWETKIADVRFTAEQDGYDKAIFSVLRNLHHAGMSTAFMAQATGRTEEEVQATLEKLGLTGKKD